MLWLIPLERQLTDIWRAIYRWPILRLNPIASSTWFAALVTLALNTSRGALGGLIVALAKGAEEPPPHESDGADMAS